MKIQHIVLSSLSLSYGYSIFQIERFNGPKNAMGWKLTVRIINTPMIASRKRTYSQLGKLSRWKRPHAMLHREPWHQTKRRPCGSSFLVDMQHQAGQVHLVTDATACATTVFALRRWEKEHDRKTDLRGYNMDYEAILSHQRARCYGAEFMQCG